MNNKIQKFFEDKSECTGCTACESVCPENCIIMSADEQGFLYPSVNEEKCVGCFSCIKVCPVKK